MELQGLSAIVTGGGSGMGEATARALAADGVKVSLFDVNEKAAQAVAEEIDGYALACDVADGVSVERAVAAANERHGPARLCVNCAGIAPAARIVSKKGAMPLDDFSRVIQIILIGTFNVMRIAAETMLSLPLAGEERGVIINTASIAAYEGQVGQAAYSASKGGIVSLTLPAAREFAKFGVRVNTIAPGLIATPLLLNMPQEVQDGLAASVPFPKRLGKPEEFAKLVLHVIANPMINGEVIRLDGALRMQG